MSDQRESQEPGVALVAEPVLTPQPVESQPSALAAAAAAAGRLGAPGAPGAPSAGQILALQRSAGNATVARLLAPGFPPTGLEAADGAIADALRDLVAVRGGEAQAEEAGVEEETDVEAGEEGADAAAGDAAGAGAANDPAGAAAGGKAAANANAGAAGAAAGGAAGAANAPAGAAAGGKAAANANAGAAGAAAGGAAGAANASAGAAAGGAAGAANASAGAAAGGKAAANANAGAAGAAAGGAAGAANASAGAAAGGAAGAANASAGAAAGGAAGAGAANAPASGNAAGTAGAAAGGAAGAANAPAGAAGSASASAGAGHASANAAAGAGAGAGGGGGGGGETISGPVPGDLLDAPDPGAAPSLTEPLEAAPPAVEQPTVDAPAEGEPDVATDEIASAGEGVQEGTGGLLGSVSGLAASALQGLIGAVTGSAAGAASGAAGAVGQMAGDQLNQGRTAADESVQATETEAGSASAEAGTAAEETRGEARGTVDRALDAVTGVPGKVGGQVQGLIGSVLGGSGLLTTLLGPFGAAFNAVLGALPADLETAVRRLGARIGAVITRVEGVVTRIAGRIAAVLAGVAGFAARVATAVRSRVAGLASLVAERVAALPGPIRAIASSIVGRLTALVQRIVDRIIQAALRLVTRVTSWLTARLRAVEAVVRRVLAGMRRILDGVINGITRIITAIRERVNRVVDWVLGKARALIARALRAVLKPLQDRLLARVLELIGPAVQEAVKRAQLMFPNGLPAPPAVEQAASQVAAQAPPGGSGPGFIDSLMRPEGDHIGVGFQYSGSAAAGVGGQAYAGAMLDVVLDYRRNDIGFFVSPGFGSQATLLDGGLTAGAGGAAAWGTVASFGNPQDDVLSSFGGWFTNANYGAQGKLAVGGGAQVQTGGSFYHGGQVAIPGAPTVSYTPPGSHHTVPGTPGTTTTTPGTPDVAGRTPLGDVLFPTGADVPPGGAVEAAAQTAQAIPAQQQGTTITSIEVVGHTSRGWRHLPPGQTREQANRELSDRRGRNVADRLRALVAPTATSSSGAGDSVAAAAGKDETDLSPSDQRASMTALTNRAGTPGSTTTTPGTPDREVDDPVTIGPSLPMPFQRAAWGWDTTVGAGALAGAEGAAGFYAGIGLSYSIPLGKTHMQADTMQKIRTAVGYFKLAGDVLSLSPLGFIRDLMGLNVPVAADATSSIGGAATSWTLPRPA